MIRLREGRGHDMWNVTEEMLDALAIGAGILGTGGGGNPYLGKLEALQQLQGGQDHRRSSRSLSCRTMPS